MAKIKINPNDIIGRRLERLEVESYIGYETKDTKGGPRIRHYYSCRCDCGRTKIIQRGNLFNHTHSCGCLKKEGRNEFKQSTKNI